MGCHIFDPVFSALALTAPLSIRSEGPAPSEHSWSPDVLHRYLFPGTAYTAEKTLPFTWYDGERRPPAAIQALAIKEGADPADKAHKLPDQGSILIGTEGVLVIPHVAAPRLIGKKV